MQLAPTTRPIRGQRDLATLSTHLAVASLVVLFVAAPLTVGLAMLLSGPLALAGLICAVVARRRTAPTDADEVLLARAAVAVAAATLALHVAAFLLGATLVVVFRHWMDSWSETAVVTGHHPPLALPTMSTGLLDLRLLLLPLRGE